MQEAARAKGLYSPDDVRDNCGFGMIAHRRGEASHDLVRTAIHSLSCMTHRGAIAADGKTGDGCGLMLKMPQKFFRTIAEEQWEATLSPVFAVGMVFLHPDAAMAAEAQRVLGEQIRAEGLQIVGWRPLPVNPEVCGEIARRSLPQFQQVFVDAPGHDEASCNRKLFLARRRAEQRLASDEYFYVPSLSASVVVYKGLVMPADLTHFYTDLADERLTSSIVVFHQRFSTNTLPRWPLAHPFRYLAHNGEINTISGNRAWAMARAPKFVNPLLPGVEKFHPLVNLRGSDSSSMDNMLEILISGGMDLFRALRLMVPPAWQNVETMDADLRAFYEYNSKHMEAWDGPAGIVTTDGRYAVCMLDRNGLRPSRWVITRNGYITLASEIGVWDYRPEEVVAKGRVGPGQILAVDTQSGELLRTADIDARLKAAHPYKDWLRTQVLRIDHDEEVEKEFCRYADAEQLKVQQKLFLMSMEERDQILRPLAEVGQEAVGSMGDDTPMAVLSLRERHLADYFRQQFAQVTNPPIDPLREAIVMSLETCLGAEQHVFEVAPKHADRAILASPVLSHSKMEQIRNIDRPGYRLQQIDLFYAPERGLRAAIEDLCRVAESAVRSGVTLLLLSDRKVQRDLLPIHALLATGAVHHHLIDCGLRCDANVLLETGTARDPHHFATLIGFGATAIYPYLAYDVIHDMVRTGELLGDPLELQSNYRKGLNKGLLKILSKMGISTVASYRGAQLFEAVGLASEVVNLCFRGVASRIEGAGFAELEQDQKALQELAFKVRQPVDVGGVLKFVHGKEYHAFNPDVIADLHRAVHSGDYQHYRQYADRVNGRPVATLRDLMVPKAGLTPIDLAQVEGIEAILPRFDSAGMSLGALSPEAHESIAIAMNTLGGRSNSGEGGEDPARYGTLRNSKIKQVASGRFGVTPAYLMSAEVLQIKVAQGAKPGEGGQLPGGKVNALIARLRYSVPGVTLISPPPHHDIYSIEDLAQLIFDLKQVNPQAQVSVKLVSEPGVGTIAAGVATQREDLREQHYIGEPEMLMNFFRFVAMETREWMARFGVRSLAELIGRTDLLEILPGVTSKHQRLDLRPLLANPHVQDKPQFCQVERNQPFDQGILAERMVAAILPAIEKRSGGVFEFKVGNCDRSLGARLSGEIARRYGDLGMQSTPIELRLTGTAGQSFGVWNAGGLHMHLEGDANDYVGKGMAGGKLVIVPPTGSPFASQETAIIGNTCLYGATGGRLFAAGTAGERFAVRNSGCHAVIEGAGDHCCEYMTGGLVTVLGRTGLNFGAGMTGGFAYVLDLENDFFDRCNHELIDLHRISTEPMEAHRHHLREVLEEYVAETDSAWGRSLLQRFDEMARKFWLVKPKAANMKELLNSVRRNPM